MARTVWTSLGRAAVWSLSCVGALSIALAVHGLLAAPSAQPSWTDYRPRPDTRDHLLALASGVNAPVRSGGGIELLVGSDRYLPALLEAIAQAQESVHVSTYVWEDGEFSDTLLAALTERARAGVSVRVLLDAHGSRNLPMDVVDPLRQAGGRVAVFAPLGFGELTRFHRRNHRRAIVIDGIVGFTGGVGVADAWLGSGAEPGSWRDDLARVTGPLARSLQGDFAQPWFSVTGELLTGPDVYPPESAPSVVDEVEEAPVPHHVSVASAPSPNHHPLRTVWWLSFAGARERIWITTPYFVPSEELRAVLRDRARAGVDVRLVTAGEHIDIPWVRWAGQRRYEDLLEAGVRIYEYQPTLIHSKRLVVDGTWSIVGSANIDRRSERLNYENVLTVLDGRFAAEMEDAFREDLAHARPIDLTAWRERGFFVRLRERVAGLLEEQL